MAYKRNPMRSERIASLARFVGALEPNANQTHAVQYFERTLDDSANRRLVIPEAFLATDAILILMENVARGLEVHEARIRHRVMDELPFMATEEILMEACKTGADRQELHERIRQASQLAAEQVKLHGRPNDLLARLQIDPALQKTVRAATYEVVLPRPATDRLTYERALPLELLPFSELTDKFHSLGTAFSIAPGG
jgi:adenylosuccinate lyase